MSRLDDTFARISGAAVTRPHDESPTGRRPLVMQAERNVRVEVGDRMVADLAAPLDLLLTSARWLARRAGEELEAIAVKLHEELAPMYGEGAVPLNALISRLAPVTQAGVWLDGLIADLTRRW